MQIVLLGVSTALWAWAIGAILMTRDWRKIAADLRAHPLDAGGGYGIAGLGMVATCPLWVLLF